MSEEINKQRRRFSVAVAVGAAAAPWLLTESTTAHAHADGATNIAGTSFLRGADGQLKRLEPLKHVSTSTLDIAYFEAGPASGPVVLLMHGYPYDIHSFVDVVPLLVAKGMRVIVPYLRGHGETRFRHKETPRSGQQSAIGMDLVELLDALKIGSAVFAGYDWGGRASCIAAALWPERCKGLVSVNSYNIQDIAHSTAPIAPHAESGLWYQYYFQTERGRAGLAADRKGITKVIWTRNSPTWRFDEATLERTTRAFDNPDYVNVVIHSYRHRLGLAPTYAPYADIEAKLALQPKISVPVVTLDGEKDGVVGPTDGASSAQHFSGKRIHRVIPGVGHNLPQEAPEAFANAVLEVTIL